jgi:hypothetical protein
MFFPDMTLMFRFDAAVEKKKNITGLVDVCAVSLKR